MKLIAIKEMIFRHDFLTYGPIFVKEINKSQTSLCCNNKVHKFSRFCLGNRCFLVWNQPWHVDCVCVRVKSAAFSVMRLCLFQVKNLMEWPGGGVVSTFAFSVILSYLNQWERRLEVCPMRWRSHSQTRHTPSLPVDLCLRKRAQNRFVSGTCSL